MKDAIVTLLNRDDAVGRLALTTAIIRLYARQTSDEQGMATTVNRNGRGFSAFHAKQGSYMARWALGASRHFPQGAISTEQWDAEVAKLKSGQSTPIRLISGRYVETARKIAFFHIRQLIEEAEQLAARRKDLTGPITKRSHQSTEASQPA